MYRSTRHTRRVSRNKSPHKQLSFFLSPIDHCFSQSRFTSRLTWETSITEATVIRVAGGRAAAALPSLLVLSAVGNNGAKGTIMVVHHTDCGLVHHSDVEICEILSVYVRPPVYLSVSFRLSRNFKCHWCLLGRQSMKGLKGWCYQRLWRQTCERWDGEEHAARHEIWCAREVRWLLSSSLLIPSLQCPCIP